ncbi:tyrosine-type recombinase/integrase [Streptomyces swartbergensis]|uniref:Recombinase XerD n=1 Tax=Streptomyces swartbergensis TaxID=487165 RepID=A0A243S2L8_9ACTN|nr:tyrosine-type recombinase/integrase [Streptomyces swartbergensis]OUD01756.1 recombinase XerD [Streptomyces swartbergensis]
MRAFPVKMPSGLRYWTVVDDDFHVVPIVDQWLRHLLFGRSRAELTTYAYAISAALYLRWCLKTGRDWRVAARDLGLFVVWLRHTKSTDGDALLLGPGAKPARGDRRINRVLSAVRGLLTFAVSVGEAPSTVLGQIYEIADGRDLPEELQGENGLAMRIGVQHRLQEPETAVDRATDAEVVALFKACRNARDRLIVLLLARVGLRRGQAAGLHRCDCHLLMDSRALGCDVPGPHIHVIRRRNPNQAWSKSRKSWVQPVDFLVVQAYDQYIDERHERLGTGGSDLLLVNEFREPLGAPMPPGAINELLEELGRRADLDRPVAPHMLRHTMAGNAADAGATEDELQALLGHKHPSSQRPYRHPSHDRLREAVRRVPSPRSLVHRDGDQ